jgi:DNA-binding NarL/FixJ family response regulator
MRVAIADDSALFREGLELQLTRSGQQVVIMTRTGDELLALIGRQQVDAAILDVRMPPTFTDEGLQTAEQLAARHPEVGILLLSAYAETAYAERLFAPGTERRGYLLKDQVDDAAALCDALKRICRGESVVDDLIVKRLLRRQESRNELAILTERERLVLQYMAEGRSNAGIAGIMYISDKTVEAYVARIFTKLGLAGTGAANRRVLAVLAWLRTNHSGIRARPAFVKPPPLSARTATPSARTATPSARTAALSGLPSYHHGGDLVESGDLEHGGDRPGLGDDEGEAVVPGRGEQGVDGGAVAVGDRGQVGGDLTGAGGRLRERGLELSDVGQVNIAEGAHGGRLLLPRTRLDIETCPQIPVRRAAPSGTAPSGTAPSGTAPSGAGSKAIARSGVFGHG